MRVLTAAQMKQAESLADANGTSYKQLMENAGTAAAQTIERLAFSCTDTAPSALLLGGKGNNAGDAFVIARLLAKKK